MKKIIILIVITSIICSVFLSLSPELTKEFHKININIKKAHEYGIHGIDVSHHQGKIDWSIVSQQNVKFCFIKATEGVSFKDKRFNYNLREAKKNGLLVGAYHYFRFNKDINRQLKNFTTTVEKNSIDFPPVVDVEIYGNEALLDMKNKKKFINDLKTLLVLLENHYGVKPIVYTDHSFYHKLLVGELNYPYWMSDLRGQNLPYLDSTEWKFWQYSFLGRKRGINSYVDLNVFNGDINELKNLKFNTR